MPIIVLIFYFSVSQFLINQGFILTVNLKVETNEAPLISEVFWYTKETKNFNASQSKTRKIEGSLFQELSFAIQPDAIAIRLDPIPETGEVWIKAIKISAILPFINEEWSLNNLYSQIDETRFIKKQLDSDLIYLKTNRDPQFSIEILEPIAKIQTKVRTLSLILALVLGLTFFLLFLKRSVNASHREKYYGLFKANKNFFFGILTFTLVVGVVGVGGYTLVQLAKKSPSERAPEYLQFVNHFGQQILDRSDDSKIDGFKVYFDPLMAFRYFPNQNSRGYIINKYGFRETFDPADKRPKIFLLGGSSAFSLHISNEDKTISGVLRKILPQYQIVNAGIVGALSGQELSYMVHYLDSYLPAVYISFSGWNDIYGQIYPKVETARGYNRHLVLQLESALQRACQQCPKDFSGSFERGDSKAEILSYAFWYEKNLLKMKMFAEARGAKFFAVIQPEVGSRITPTPEEKRFYERFTANRVEVTPAFSEQYQLFITEALRLARIDRLSVYNMNADFVFQNNKGALFVDQVHLNTDGADLVAKLLKKNLNL